MVSDIFNITMNFINKWAINKNDVFINGIYFQTNMLFEQPNYVIYLSEARWFFPIWDALDFSRFIHWVNSHSIHLLAKKIVWHKNIWLYCKQFYPLKYKMEILYLAVQY